MNPREAADAAWANGTHSSHDDKYRFRAVRFDDIKLPTDASYLVQGIIPREGITVVWGKPKCGKSFWAYDVVQHVALGREYRGRRVHRGAVVYIAAEGARGLGARTEAFRTTLSEKEKPDFYLISARMGLVTDANQLIADIRAQTEGEQIAAIVVDTLNRTLEGSESSDEDMAAYIKALDTLWQEFICAVMVIHHCGHDGSRPRGHSSLAAAADAQIAIERNPANQIVATVEFMKDGPDDAEPIASILRVVQVGVDDDGEPITSCIVEPVDIVTPQSAADKRVSPLALKYHRALQDAQVANGQQRAQSGGRVSATMDQWRDECVRLNLIDPTEKEDSARSLFSKYKRE